MKHIFLFILALTSATAQIPKPTMKCTFTENGTATDCNNLKQENFCNTGTTKTTEVKITATICSGTIDDNKTMLVVRGPANGGRTDIAWKDMTDESANGNNCITKSSKVIVDTCKPYFNAQLDAIDNTGKGNNWVFDSYMKRNCPLETNITCQSPSGKECFETRNACESGDFKYMFCYSTSFTQHEITIRPMYYPKEAEKRCNQLNNKQGCDFETHAYMYAWGDKFLQDFSKPTALGPDRKQFCYTHTENIDTCDKGVIPKAYVNVVGSVTGAFGEKPTPIEEYKSCFSTFVYSDIAAGAPNPQSPSPPSAPSKGRNPSKGGTRSPGSSPSKGSKKTLRTRH